MSISIKNSSGISCKIEKLGLFRFRKFLVFPHYVNVVKSVTRRLCGLTITMKFACLYQSVGK